MNKITSFEVEYNPGESSNNKLEDYTDDRFYSACRRVCDKTKATILSIILKKTNPYGITLGIVVKKRKNGELRYRHIGVLPLLFYSFRWKKLPRAIYLFIRSKNHREETRRTIRSIVWKSVPVALFS